MAWTFKYFESYTRIGAQNEVQNELNKLTPAQMTSAKLCFTVTENIYYRKQEIGGLLLYIGVIIYDASITSASIPDRANIVNKWRQIGFASDTNNTDFTHMSVWQNLVDFFNNPVNGLTPPQAYYSMIAMNHSGDYATTYYYNTNVSIWYPLPNKS